MLSQKDKEQILQEFPKIKLSYETIIHKKVYNSDFIISIPDGKKSFAWFTMYKDKMVCFLLELNNKNKKEIKNIKIINCCFSTSLAYGTIFYGTLFYHLNNPFFSIEDIFFYKGKEIPLSNFNNKIKQICNILNKDLKQISYNNYFIVFGLPIICNSEDDFKKHLITIKYKLSAVQYRNINNNNSYYVLPFDEYNIRSQYIEKNIKIDKNEKNIKNQKFEKNINQKQSKIFEIKPDIQNDIYHLYSQDNQYVGLACVPDYKTSVMMNKLFRIIKENNDLDALEESDDEEEFENSNIDKFVYLEKSYKMVCIFNNKFKKWVPIKITE